MSAPFAPMSENGMEVNYDLVAPYAKDLVTQGIQGVWVCGTTGESFSLTSEERKKLLEAWVATEEFKKGFLYIIVQVGCQNLPDTIDLAIHAEKCGAQAISVMPPCYYKPKNEAQVLDWLAPIIKAVPEIAFYYYHIPGMSGININVSKLLKMGRDERKFTSLIGAKYSHLDFQDYAQCIKDGFYILHGSNNFLLNALLLNGQGGVGRDANYSGEIHRKILDSFEKGDVELALKYQNKSKDLIELVFSLGDPMVVAKYLMKKLRNLDLGGVRLPTKNLSTEEMKKIDSHVEKMKTLTSLDLK